MLSYIEYLEEHVGISGLAVAVLVALFFILQVIGELLEFKGKVVPEFLKIRKLFQRRKQERQDTQQTLKEVKKLLADVDAHYSKDNIAKRDSWMNWVNSRAEVYDKTIVSMTKNMSAVTEALNANTRMTEEMFIQSSRDRVLDFASKVSDENALVSREEFHRILKVYNEYETFLSERDRTNGEIDIAYRIITEAYETRLKNSSFTEDKRGYR